MNWIRVITLLLGIKLCLMLPLAIQANGLIQPTVVLDGLKAPRGLTPLPDGSLLIAEVMGGRLLRWQPGGRPFVVAEAIPATLGGPMGLYPTGISAGVRVDEQFFWIVGEFRGRGYSTLYRLIPGGAPEAVAGGRGRDGFPATPLTNPYDLVSRPEGGFFVSDGGANAVFYITASGDIFDYARFPDQPNPAYPDDSVSPQIDVVPTGLGYGPDGALYVASFGGLPYPSGIAAVHRLEDRNADGDALDDGENIRYASGFTAATDLAFEANGSLLVTEFSIDMESLLSDFNAAGATQAPGRLVRWRNGKIETVADGLVSPTAVAIIDGRSYVSEEFAGRISEIVLSERATLSPARTMLLLGGALFLGLIIWQFYKNLRLRSRQES